MQLVLVRHGQTEENANFVVQGHRFGTLSPLGKQQAQTVGKKLADEHFDVVYASDLERCVDTAKAICKYHPKTPLYLRTELREFNFGIFEGHSVKHVKWMVTLGVKAPKKIFGVESAKDLRSRLIPFINRTYKKHPNASVLVVTHGGPIRIIKTVIEGLPLTSNRSIDVPNCSVWRYTIDKPIPERIKK